MNENERPPADLIGTKQAARILKTHLSTIYRLIHSGKLRAWSRCGTRHLLSEADVREQLRPFTPPPLPPRKPATPDTKEGNDAA